MSFSYENLKTVNDALIAEHPDIQGASLAGLAASEELLRFATFTHADAFALGLRLKAAAEALPAADRKPVVVDISVNGQCLFRYAAPGSSRDNDAWIARKKKTVERFAQSSYRIGRTLALAGTSLGKKYDVAEGEYAAHGGCWPITLRGGVMIGTITMSGLSQVLDHVVISRVLAEFLQGAQ
ncbi:hypothetical protein FIBSPDRAFT_868471 [Athelia psychrophila]|uniref:DUF336-domain-containing protein n=1 Tax=Athelia psychrophila TaxID=1759441 RepID=A0A166D2M6_9AGAM|nr:hypothetical protein FIBSPDRAFT_868471 [Fibularhizoctonia sp. CBS 109695]